MGDADGRPGRDRTSALRHSVGAGGDRPTRLREEDREDATAGDPTGDAPLHRAIVTVAARDLDEEWLRDPAYRSAYEALDEEFALAESLIRARARAGLSQADLALRMGTSQAAVARMESGRQPPSYRTLQRLASATGSQLRISFMPI